MRPSPNAGLMLDQCLRKKIRYSPGALSTRTLENMQKMAAISLIPKTQQLLMSYIMVV